MLCFCAPVKQRKNQLPQVTLAKKSTAPTAEEMGIYLGGESYAASARRQSNVQPLLVPPPKPPRTDIKVLREIEEKQRTTPELSGTAESSPQKSPAAEAKPTTSSASSIVRSVSDYKTSDMAEKSRASMRKSRTDVLHHSPGRATKRLLKTS